MTDYKFLNYGDSTICVDFSDESAFKKSAWEMSHALSDNLFNKEYDWIVSLIPTMNSILVHYDILMISRADVETFLKEEIKNTEGLLENRRHFRIPVVYGGNYGPDLPKIASKIGCTEEEVINQHINSLNFVLCFTNPAGQPLMGGSKLPDNIHRLDEPRTRIPVGSIGIVGSQSTVYCMEAPGGWQIIGRTPARMIYTDRMPPTHLSIGDYVSFFRISEDDWEYYSGMELDNLLEE